MTRSLLALVLATVLAGCSSGRTGAANGESTAAARDSATMPRTSVRGEAFITPEESLPAAAIVRVELRDAARAESASTVLATQEFSASRGSPWSFELLAPDSLVKPGAVLVVSARINAGDRLLYATGDDASVTSNTANGPMRLQLLPITMSEGTGAGPGRLQITPAPSLTVRCGNEDFRLAFEAGAAYVTTSDGVTLTLPRLTQPGGEDPEAPRTFTNGKLTFVQEIEGAKRTTFTRGKMVPAPCTSR